MKVGKEIGFEADKRPYDISSATDSIYLEPLSAVNEWVEESEIRTYNR